MIHVAGAARLRLRCDAREFRGSLLGALRRSPALRSFRLVHLVLLSELFFFLPSESVLNVLRLSFVVSVRPRLGTFTAIRTDC